MKNEKEIKINPTSPEKKGFPSSPPPPPENNPKPGTVQPSSPPPKDLPAKK